MDPLTALGLVGNILQIIEFGFSLIREGNELHNSATGALQYNEDAEDRANQLNELTAKLTEAQENWLANHGTVDLGPNEVRLRYLCERCGEIAVELKVQLRKLKVQDGTKRRRFRSYKQALLSVWRKDQIEAIETRLEKYQREIDTHILVGLRQSTSVAQLENTERFNSLDRQTQDLAKGVLGGKNELSHKLDDQHAILIQILDKLTVQPQQRRQSTPIQHYRTSSDAVDSNRALKTPLHEAVEADDALKVRQLLRESRTDVNVRDHNGYTPLHLVKSAQVAKRLLSHAQISKDVEDYGGRTPLICAVLKRRLHVVKALLEAGAEKTLTDDQGRVALFYARDCPAATWMLRHGCDVEVIDERRSTHTGLIHMASLDDIEGVNFLLEHGAAVDARGDKEKTALFKAARNGNCRMAELLIAQGAEVNRADVGGATPLHRAIWMGKTSLVKLLIEHGANVHLKDKSGWSALSLCATSGSVEILKELIVAGVDPDEVFNDGSRALATAARLGYTDFVGALLDCTIDVNAHGPKGPGHTALAEACHYGHLRITDMLLNHGAEHGVLKAHGMTPLAMAAAQGHGQIVQSLLDHGANIQRTDDNRRMTPLMYAAEAGQSAVIKILADHGADFNDRDDEGQSALHHAAKNKRWTSVKVLLKKGANIDHQCTLGETALMIAVFNRDVKMIQRLLDANADVMLRDKFDHTAWNYACHARNNEEILQLLLPFQDRESKIKEVQDSGSPSEIAAYLNEVYR